MVKNRRYSAASTLWIGCILALAAAALLGERAAAQQQPSKLLFLTHAGLYKHTSLGPAERAVTSWGQRAGFEVTKRDSGQIRELWMVRDVAGEILLKWPWGWGLPPSTHPLPRDSSIEW